MEGSEREGVGKRKRKEKKRKRERERKKKGKGGRGGRKSYEASTAQDCEFSTLLEQKPKIKSRPRADASGGRETLASPKPGLINQTAKSLSAGFCRPVGVKASLNELATGKRDFLSELLNSR